MKERKEMLYQVAIRTDLVSPWQWRSTPLSSLETLFAFLRLYQALPADRLQVFTAATREDLNVQLIQANRERDVHLVRSITAKLSQEGTETPGCRDAGTAGTERGQGSLSMGTENGMMHSYSAGLSSLEKNRFELEMGEGGDHDVPYLFTLPLSMPQALSWIELCIRVQNGELEA